MKQNSRYQNDENENAFNPNHNSKDNQKFHSNIFREV